MDIIDIADTIIYIINSVLVPILFAVAFLAFLYGVAQAYIFSKGDPSAVSKGHQLILWGVIGFVAMVSLWGLVDVVSNTFGLGGVGAPMLPSSQSSFFVGGSVGGNQQPVQYVECPKDASGKCI